MDPVQQARLEAIYASIKSAQGDTEPLQEEDYLLLGRFIQAFCVADFEARRVLVAMQAIVGKKSVEIRKLPDKTVIEHLASGAKTWPGQKEIGEGVAKVAAILDMHHQIRHTFAHWAGRRVKGHDALMFLSTSLSHKPPVGGHYVGPGDPGADSEFRLMEKVHIREELPKLMGHATYLGNLAKHLEDNKEELRKTFGASGKASGA
jgi:hypothetical protein